MINFIENNDKKGSDIAGLIANYEMIDYVSNGLEYYYRQLTALGDNADIMILDQQTIEKVRGFKADSIKNGPTKYIDYGTEVELIKKVNRRKEEKKLYDTTKRKSEPGEEKGFWVKLIDLFK